jgi:NlpC/P60 family putative phage cell wall peptidase
MITRAQIVAAARSWDRTPYVDRASQRGVGCDCLGLVRGVWRELVGVGEEPEAMPPYTRDWAERQRRETLLDVARRYLTEINRRAYKPGDVIAFRWRADMAVKHCAIATDAGRMIHAYQGHAVQEIDIPYTWSRKLTHAFAFPGVEST